MRKIQKGHINLQVKEYLTMTRQNNRHKDEQQSRNNLSFDSCHAVKGHINHKKVKILHLHLRCISLIQY